MQHLEVSCAVRRLFKSLGFKGLIYGYTSLGASLPENGNRAGFINIVLL